MTAPSEDRALYAYIWDLVEEDPSRLGAELRDIGLNTLTIAASYHAGKFLRPHGKSGKTVFPQDGVAHCRVHPNKYSEITPLVSDLATDEDTFGQMCSRSGMAIAAWTVLLHNSRLGALHPGSVTRTAFGDPLHYSLCPSSPAVRDYAATLCADIAESYPISALVLETPGWLPYRHGYHHEFTLLGESPRLEFYLGLCFCSNCTKNAQAAEIDVEGLRGRIRDRVSEDLAAADEPFAPTDRLWLEHELLTDPDLAAFLRWRMEVVTSLVARIRAAVRADAQVRIIPSVNQPLALSWIEGSDLAGLDTASDGLEVCYYGAPGAPTRTDHAALARRIGHPDMHAVLRPTSAEHREATGFIATVRDLAAAGVRDFGFYNYGHMRRSGLDRIGQALRAI